MKKSVLSFLAAICTLLSAGALDLELRDGTRLTNIQFVRPALHGVTLITTSPTGQSHLVTVPFSAVAVPSLYALRHYLIRNAPQPWDDLFHDPQAYSASIYALNSYLRRRAVPSVIQSGNAVFIQLGFPGDWRRSTGPAGAENVSD